MIICATALLVHISAKHNLFWNGAGAAWFIAAILDTGIVCFFIWAKYCSF